MVTPRLDAEQNVELRIASHIVQEAATKVQTTVMVAESARLFSRTANNACWRHSSTIGQFPVTISASSLAGLTLSRAIFSAGIGLRSANSQGIPFLPRRHRLCDAAICLPGRKGICSPRQTDVMTKQTNKPIQQQLVMHPTPFQLWRRHIKTNITNDSGNYNITDLYLYKDRVMKDRFVNSYTTRGTSK